MYQENPEGTQVILGSMNIGYISDTAMNRTHNLAVPSQAGADPTIPQLRTSCCVVLRRWCCGVIRILRHHKGGGGLIIDDERWQGEGV